MKATQPSATTAPPLAARRRRRLRLFAIAGGGLMFSAFAIFVARSWFVTPVLHASVAVDNFRDGSSRQPTPSRYAGSPSPAQEPAKPISLYTLSLADLVTRLSDGLKEGTWGPSTAPPLKASTVVTQPGAAKVAAAPSPFTPPPATKKAEIGIFGAAVEPATVGTPPYGTDHFDPVTSMLYFEQSVNSTIKPDSLREFLGACALKYPQAALDELTTRYRAFHRPIYPPPPPKTSPLGPPPPRPPAPPPPPAPSHPADGPTATGAGHVFIAAMFHTSAEVLPTFMAAVSAVISQLGKHRVFVSVIESGSWDQSHVMLRAFEEHLKAAGVGVAISTGVELVQPVFRPGNPTSGNRIAFLARLRNAALDPLFRLAEMPAPKKRLFDKVVFVNDVLLCGGDLLKLMASPADMACGFDFNRNVFWDNWVHEPAELVDREDKHSTGWPPPCMPRSTVHNETTCPYNGNYTFGVKLGPPLVLDGARINATAAKEGALSNFCPPAPCVYEQPVPVACCWNGGVAINADVFYAGVRFRRGKYKATKDDSLVDQHDCAASECTLLCRDMRRMGFNRIVADPTVQLAYQYRGLWAWRFTRDHHAGAPGFVGPPFFEPQGMRCCPLPADGAVMVSFLGLRIVNAVIGLDAAENLENVPLMSSESKCSALRIARGT